MGTLANAFALLADEQGQEASTIVALKSDELKKLAEEKKKIAEEKKKSEAKKKKKSSARDGGGRGKANQEHKAVNQNQERVSVRTVVLSKKESHEQWVARETERKKAEAARKELWLAREEERKKDMELKTLKEYEEEKAYEKKQKAEKADLSVPETRVREATKDETVKKNNNTEKYWKVHKTINIEEFSKLPTGREEQDGPGKVTCADSEKNKNGDWTKYSRNRAAVIQEYALPDTHSDMKVKSGPVPDLSEASFPVLGRATKPTKFCWEQDFLVR